MIIKRSISILFLILLYSPFSYCQLSVLVDEDFSNNLADWTEDDHEEYRREVKDGYYYLTHKAESGGRSFNRKFYVDPHDNWIIETDVTQVSGVENRGYGIYMGGNSHNKFFLFQLASTGFVKFNKYNGDKWVNITEWMETDAVNSLGASNKVKIEKKGHHVKFYVNGKKVYTHHSSIPFYGSKFGWHLQNKMQIKVNNYKIETTKRVINLVKGADKEIERRNLGEKINTQYDEVNPVISPDGRELIFVSKDNPGNMGEKNKEDAWISYKDNEGNWSQAVTLPGPINNNNHNAVRGVSAGANAMLLNNKYFKDGTGKEGLSMTRKTLDGWSFPENLYIEEYSNDGSTSSACWSANEKVIIVSVERDEGYGNSDLYVSFHKSGNNWSSLKNLGSTINTGGLEMGPFLAPDGKSLYFSSDAHPGYGGKDIFVSRRLDDTWTKWSEPENLGPYVNSDRNESYFTISASGEHAYLVSSKNSLGKGDIFELDLGKESRPEPVLLLSGTVMESKSMTPISAPVTLHDLGSDKELGTVHSDPATGKYEIVLPKGHKYSLYAEKKGYYAVRTQFEIDTLKEFQEVIQDLYMTPIQVGENIRLNNIFFERSKAKMLLESEPELNRLALLLKDHPKMKIRIEGHTDQIGSQSLNQRLSEDRAKVVRDYLIEKGISKKRLEFKGYGGSKPIAPNNNERNRSKNRRVEFVVLNY